MISHRRSPQSNAYLLESVDEVHFHEFHHYQSYVNMEDVVVVERALDYMLCEDIAKALLLDRCVESSSRPDIS